MVENIICNINDHAKLNNKPNDIDKFIEEFNNKMDDEFDLAYVYELDYDTNYTVKSLVQILDYYNICKRKLKKNEMINKIIHFEMDSQNVEKVERRKRLWQYIKELKNDDFMSKFIIF